MKRGFIALMIGVLIAACGFLGGNSPILGGPDPAAQKSTAESMTHQAETQKAMIDTQVAEGIAKLAQQSPIPQAAEATPSPQIAGAAETKAAQKTAAVAQLLTAAAGTPSEASTQAGDVAPLSSPVPQMDPKSSDGTDFSGAHFYAWGQWNPDTYGVTIELTGPGGGNGGKNFSMKVSNNVLDKCLVPLDFPNRLYCTGKPFNGGKHTIEVYENVNGQQVLRFTDKYTFPAWTSTPEKKPTKTPKQGEE